MSTRRPKLTLARSKNIGASSVATPAAQVVHTSAEDGVLLHLDRYARRGAPPVLMVHGWMQSPRAMDSELPGRSMARYLHRAGFDIFVGCLRGHGHRHTRSGARGAWSPEDHAALDLPALVSRVRQLTGRDPAVVGHSLGALTALMYLSGAVRRGDRTVPDKAAALRRNAGVSRVVAIAPPMSFPERAIALISERPDLAGKLLCRFGASRVGGVLLDRIPRVNLRGGLDAMLRLPAGRRVRRLLVRAASSGASRALWCPENMPSHVIAAELSDTLDATSGAELRQLATWVVNGGLNEPGGTDWRPALAQVEVPTLFIAGARDGVSTPRGVAEGASLVGNGTGDFHVVPDAGHNDLRVGDAAVREVFPTIAGWLHASAGGARLARPSRRRSL